MEMRTKPLRGTGFSPFEMCRTWKFVGGGNEVTEAEEDELIELAEQDNASSSMVISDEWSSFAARFSEVQERVRAAAAGNIAKEELRQKKSYDLRSLNHGEDVSPGNQREALGLRFPTELAAD